MHRPPPMARRAWIWVLVLVLAVPAMVPAAAGGYRPVDEESFDVTSRSVVVIAPAVGERADGTLSGVGMQMEVTVRDGTGGVYIDTRPLTQLDMQGSARLAAMTASATAGADMGEHDFIVTVRSPVPAVGGPSAGATMTVAFTALLLDLPLRDDVVMTGMINADGSIGPVGGILEKAEAADRAGASLYLIPEGQRIVRQVVREEDDSGWFPTVRTREERVDVAEEAKERWGLDVREVGDLYEAIELMTDHRIERPEPPASAPEPLFEDVMRAASADQMALAADALSRQTERLENSPVQENPQVADQLGELLHRAEDLLERAGSARGNGSYYTASSLTFQALVDLRSVQVWLDVIDAPDDRAALQEAGREAADRLAAARQNATGADPQTVSSLEAVGAAQERVFEAERLLDQAEAALAEDRLPATVQSLAFGIERTRSVDWWLGISRVLADEEDGARLQAEPRDLATDYLGIAQQAVIYAEVLLSQTGEEGMQQLVEEAARSLRSAEQARSEGLDVGALFLAMEAQVTAHAALSLVGGEALLGDRLERQRDQALIEVARTRGHGAEPFLAISYVEFAESLAADRPLDALLMYGKAATIAATSAALATGELCGFGGVSCPGGAPAVHRMQLPAPDPWTAYLALATVLLGFMAGILVTLVVLQARDRRHQESLHPVRMGPTGAGWRRVPMRRPRPAMQTLTSRRLLSRAGHDRPRAPIGQVLTRLPPRRGNAK